jgi:L-malate glycosyltransferase
MSERPLRVLGIGPGRSINFIRWARVVREQGHEVHVVSDVVSDQDDWDGVAAHNIRSLAPVMRIRGVRRPFFGTVLARFARRVGADVVHAHYLLPYGYWGAQAHVHPYVVSPWSRDIFHDPNESRRGRRRALASIAAADYVVTNSQANERASIELGADPGRMRKVIWYAETERFGREHAEPTFRSQRGWPDDALVLLSLRNFRAYTNLDVLVRAFANVASEEPRARLLLAARGGDRRGEIEALVDELGIRPLVSIERIGWGELPTVTASSDVAVSIADTDSTPASLLETMASGVPLICGDAPSIDEWVREGEGAEMVDRRDPDVVAAAVVRLLRDPDLRRRYGDRNAAFVRKRLAEPPGVALERLYRQLAAT